MRSVTYAGQNILTADDVAEAMVALSVALSNERRTEVVTVPICTTEGNVATADLVIGAGNDVISVPVEWMGEEPDFDDAAERLRAHVLYPSTPIVAAGNPPERGVDWAGDLDLDIDRG
ncbi:MAG: hypothetical protein CMH34_06935 [Microbacterium sp.]|uniref:hypothetical protein n=1 Tax=Microbacterium aquimaris TaxID=459816 RepID=UPI000C95CFF7|nr:hypothetical protein [Microbacterium aquimaris]MAP63467.1 hypothetical protein [Microbacterium sp.]MDZ8274908.1 hypothetical protein [Microbacterium aquimaris]